MHPIGVGILGAGRISDLHAIEYLRNAAARIVAVCDQADRAGDEPRPRPGACRRAGVHDAGRRCSPATRSISVEMLLPHHLHRAGDAGRTGGGQGTSRCRSRWRRRLADADDGERRRSAGGRFFKVFENFVFYPPVQKAKELLDEGAPSASR